MNKEKIEVETMMFHLNKNTKGFYHNYFKFNGEYSHNVFITDPYHNETKTLKVDPKKYYGLTDKFLKRFNEDN